MRRMHRLEPLVGRVRVSAHSKDVQVAVPNPRYLLNKNNTQNQYPLKQNNASMVVFIKVGKLCWMNDSNPQGSVGTANDNI